MQMVTEAKLMWQSVTPMRVRAYCKDDGGEFISTGEGRGGLFGTKWIHRCSVCSVLAEFDKTFPYVEYEE